MKAVVSDRLVLLLLLRLLVLRESRGEEESAEVSPASLALEGAFRKLDRVGVLTEVDMAECSGSRMARGEVRGRGRGGRRGKRKVGSGRDQSCDEQ